MNEPISLSTTSYNKVRIYSVDGARLGSVILYGNPDPFLSSAIVETSNPILYVIANACHSIQGIILQRFGNLEDVLSFSLLGHCIGQHDRSPT